jgi:anaphase-promoting complex subunit 4
MRRACLFCVKDQVNALLSFHDTELLILCPDEAPIITHVPIQSDTLPYGAYDVDSPADMSSIPSSGFPEYKFPSDKTIRPVAMEVHDRSNIRGEIPARICLLDGNRMILRTFSIPA